MMTPIKKAAGGFKTTTATTTHNATDFIATGASKTSAERVFHACPGQRTDWLQYRAVQPRDTIQTGASNTIKLAGNLPESEVFSRPESFGFGRDGLVRKAGRMTNFMFETSRPPVARSIAASGFQSQLGAEAMTNVNTSTTPNAAPLGITPTSSTARQQAIENALSLALFHIRKGDTHQAVAKSIRATSLLKQSCSDLFTGSV